MDVNAGTLSYGQNIEGIGSVGAGIIYMNYGYIQQNRRIVECPGNIWCY